MIPHLETTPSRRPPARSAGSTSASAAADGAVDRRAGAFDDAIKLRAEILREVDILEQMGVAQAKRDDALLRKYIEMI